MEPGTKQSRLLAKILTALVVIAFGVMVLLHQLGFKLPTYLFSWELILILIGTISLIKHRFRMAFGYFLIAIGVLFMINDYYPEAIEMRFVWPVLIILFGIMIFVKAISKKDESEKFVFLNDQDADSINGDDFFETTAFFGGITKNIVSKDFKGARVKTVFGGTELNLSNADFAEKAVIDLTTVFGGVTIIVPSTWSVQSQITSVFGGIDDKRRGIELTTDSSKTLVLKGNCVFGGVEIASYV